MFYGDGERKRELNIDSSQNPKYVFTRHNGTPYTQPEFTNILQKILRDGTGLHSGGRQGRC
jgi:hypothetical protein